ncbi:MAG TPA: hypothetical protein VM617_07145 [Thermoanaerobaculia bacterium]|nr:hypothetical protein [Thermoanaerobaculia bacterium]
MKPSRWVVPALAVALLLGMVVSLSACGRGDDEADIAENLEETGTLDVLERAGEDEYDPPSDGELTEDQVEMYLAVQERAVKIRQVTGQRLREKQQAAEAEGKEVGFMDALRSMGDVSDWATAEIRAAQELGHNTAEYQWVQGQVMEAQVARMTRGMQEQMGAAGQQFLTIMREQAAATTDAEQKAELERQIAEYEAGLEESATADDFEPGTAHNIELLEDYQDRLEAINRSAQEEATN